MKKSVNLKSFTLFSLIGAGVVILVGLVMFLIMGGNTVPMYTTANLSISMFIKAFVATTLVWALSLGYYACFYKKLALKYSLISLVSSVVSGFMSLAFIVICRAPLGNFAFAVMLFSVVLSYIAFTLFVRYLNDAKPTRKSKADDEETPENKAIRRTLKVMLYVLLFAVVGLAGSFAVSMIFGSTVLCIYVLPTILSAVATVVFTLSVSSAFAVKK